MSQANQYSNLIMDKISIIRGNNKFIFSLCMAVYGYMVIGIICGLFIEVTQRMTGRGKFDTDDIMTNGAGMMV